MDDPKSSITIISPINITGNIVGTYEIIISLYPEQPSQALMIQYIVIASSIIIFILIFSLLYLLRIAIVKPIINFRNTVKIFGKGNLDAKVDINSRDEIQLTLQTKYIKDNFTDESKISFKSNIILDNIKNEIKLKTIHKSHFYKVFGDESNNEDIGYSVQHHDPFRAIGSMSWRPIRSKLN